MAVRKQCQRLLNGPNVMNFDHNLRPGGYAPWRHMPQISSNPREKMKTGKEGIIIWNFRLKGDSRSGPWGPLLPVKNLTFSYT